MARLNQAALELLDFLCAAAYSHCRIKRLKGSCMKPLRSLRYAGLVSLDGFEPSPWAFKDWFDRQEPERVIFRIYETPAQSRTPEPAGPAEPEPEEDGGGASVRGDRALPIADEAPPPDPDINETVAAAAAAQPAAAPLAPESEAVPSVVARPPLCEHEYQGASEPAREALSAALLGAAVAEQSAERIEDRAPHDEPAAVRTCPLPSPAHPSIHALADELEALARSKRWPISRIGIHLFGGPSGVTTFRNRKKPRPETLKKIRDFIDNPPDELEELEKRHVPAKPRTPRADGALGVAMARKVQTKKARNWLDAGKTIEDAPKGLQLELRQEQGRRDEAARLADPVEQAKTIIRRKTRHPVFGAEVSGGPKGKFFIGNRLVTERELLEEAARLEAA